MDIEELKFCNSCRTLKKLSEFGKRNIRTNRLCIICDEIKPIDANLKPIKKKKRKYKKEVVPLLIDNFNGYF